VSRFASRVNTPQEQQAILDGLVEHLGAREVVTGLERARQLAERTKDQRELEAPAPQPVQQGLWAA
jgi:hypothetical protein